MSKPAIRVHGLTRRFGAVTAIADIEFTVESGELFGLVGPDGAGKTTLLRMLAGVLKPQAGDAELFGVSVVRDPEAVKHEIAYMPQRFGLYTDLTVLENLAFYADLYQVPRAERGARLERLFHFSSLGPFKDRLAGALSGGMKQKLALSCALIHTPDILILDEPTYGVDPVSRMEFWDILRLIQKEGTTILVSTAYMDEADQCERVALFFEGNIAGMDTPEALKKEYRFPLFQLESDELRQLRTYFRALPEVHNTQLFGDSLHVSFNQIPGSQDWSRWERESNSSLKNYEPITPTIEDVFLDLIRGSKHEQ